MVINSYYNFHHRFYNCHRRGLFATVQKLNVYIYSCTVAIAIFGYVVLRTFRVINQRNFSLISHKSDAIKFRGIPGIDVESNTVGLSYGLVIHA